MPAFAAIVGTDIAIQVGKSEAARDQIKSMLTRTEVQQQLMAAGVSPNEVEARVDAMTDTEVASLAGKLDQAAAGGDALGTVFVIFLLLVVTDLMGWTNIFPFTKKGAWK